MNPSPNRSKVMALSLALACAFLMQTSGAWAAKKSGKRAQPETYSATEPGVVTIMVPVGSAAVTEESSDDAAAKDFEEEKTETELPPPPPSAAPAPSEPAKATAFDAVPKDQAGLIAKRLPLIEKLMTKHGRAYDYRAHTVSQLEKILADLEKAEKN